MSIPPLTSIFTPAPTCFEPVYYQSPYRTLTITATSAYYWLGPPFASECYPSGWDGSSTSQYFSPGICPSGYSAACSSRSDPESIVTCCPSSFVCRGSLSALSSPSRFAGAFVTNANCIRLFTSAAWITTINVLDASGTNTITHLVTATGAGIGAGAAGVVVRWQSTDEVILKHLSQSASTTTISSTPSPKPASTHGGLSKGAVIGLAAAFSALFVFVLIGVFTILWRRRRSAKTRRHDEVQEKGIPGATAKGKKGEFLYGGGVKAELDATAPTHELDADEAERVDKHKPRPPTPLGELEASAPEEAR